MRTKHALPIATTLAAMAVAFCASTPAFAADEAAARATARTNNCFNCHAVDKKKVGTPWHDVAVKYKGDKDAEAKLIKHMTSGEKAKFEDGHTEDHPIAKGKSPDELKNLAAWILTL